MPRHGTDPRCPDRSPISFEDYYRYLAELRGESNQATAELARKANEEAWDAGRGGTKVRFSGDGQVLPPGAHGDTYSCTKSRKMFVRDMDDISGPGRELTLLLFFVGLCDTKNGGF